MGVFRGHINVICLFPRSTNTVGAWVRNCIIQMSLYFLSYNDTPLPWKGLMIYFWTYFSPSFSTSEICVSHNKSFLYIQKLDQMWCLISNTHYTNSVYTLFLYRRTALNAALRLSNKCCGLTWTCRNLIPVLCVVSMTNYTLVPSSGC